MSGGINSGGTFFKYGAGGAVATLYSFSDPEPAGLIQGSDGNFYGVTWFGGANGLGTVFKVTPVGVHTTLYSFCSVGGTSCTDGEIPQGGVIQATDGNLYGTTVEGGAAGGYGTVFSLTPAGTLTTLHSFNNTDGSSPQTLIQSTNGTFYGVAQNGGSTECISGCGTIFSLSMGLAPFAKANPNFGNVGAQIAVMEPSDWIDRRHVQRDISSVLGRIKYGDSCHRSAGRYHGYDRSDDPGRHDHQQRSLSCDSVNRKA